MLSTDILNRHKKSPRIPSLSSNDTNNSEKSPKEFLNPADIFGLTPVREKSPINSNHLKRNFIAEPFRAKPFGLLERSLDQENSVINHVEESSSDSEHHHHENPSNSTTKLLSVADFNGDGEVNNTDIEDILERYNSIQGDDLYHPLYDWDTDGDIDVTDIVEAVNTIGAEVPLLDQQIAQAVQATMKYYGSKGLETALAEGYLPFTQEVNEHGIHYFNFNLASEIGNLEELDIERPVGLNYDAEGNLLAVFYIRVPETEEATLENPLAEILEVKAEDDFPPSSFDTLTPDDWHNHQNIWFTGLGNLNPELVFGFEEFVPVEATISRLQDTNFQLFPDSDTIFSPKFWMLHAWIHSINPRGTFANTSPDVSIYAPEELGIHGGHDQGHDSGHHGDSDPLIAGTDGGEQLIGTDESDRINSFSGNDYVAGGFGNDSIWGGQGSDLLQGDNDNNPSEGGNDMLYGGPGTDLINGQGGDDRLFGGTGADIINGGPGADLLRGGLGDDILTGNQGADTFVLAPTEGMDIITDLEIDVDIIVLYGGITTDNISINSIGNNTFLQFNEETLAIIRNVNASDVMAASDDLFLVS